LEVRVTFSLRCYVPGKGNFEINKDYRKNAANSENILSKKGNKPVINLKKGLQLNGSSAIMGSSYCVKGVCL